MQQCGEGHGIRVLRHLRCGRREPFGIVSCGASQNKSSECIKPAAATIEAITSGLNDGVQLTETASIRSDDFETVWMIAGRIEGQGGVDDVAVWATNGNPESGENGLINSIDGFAQQFSDWGAGDKTDANITQSAHGVSQARTCLGG